MTDSSRYRISHKTHYRYSSPVAICQNQLRMMPRPLETHTTQVQCHDVGVRIDPKPTVQEEHTDYYGNRVVSFAIESLHRELTVTVTSDVTIAQRPNRTAESLNWETLSKQIADCSDARWLESQEFTFDSPRIACSNVFAAYAQESFLPGKTMIQAAIDLTRRVHLDFKYDSTATDVHTSTEEAFELKAGVCQDFAHIQIACLRSIGVPARYVSGYLRTIPAEGKPRLVGADESHAWVSIYFGDKLGWIDFDPTNDCIAGNHHIPICIGRDYNEVSPMRGVVVGGGMTTLNVQVDVQPV